MKFLIQTDEDRVLHDFTFVLDEALRFDKWMGRNYHKSTHCKDYSHMAGFVPVGSVEFVQGYLKYAYNLTVKPRNVPPELMSTLFSGRPMRNMVADRTVDLSKDNLHVKSNDHIKMELDLSNLAPGSYQISPIQDYSSEWRAFIWRGDLVGLQNYAGDFTEFPDINAINRMIRIFDGPCAYTLDVGIRGGCTWVVEVHDFFSCGLYGFADLRLLPIMFSGWFNEFLRKNK